MQFLEKSAEKVLEKWGGGPILIDYFESCDKMLLSVSLENNTI